MATAKCTPRSRRTCFYITPTRWTIPYHLTLIRLPGYPIFMAVIFSVFGIMNYNAVRYVQAFLDMGTVPARGRLCSRSCFAPRRARCFVDRLPLPFHRQLHSDSPDRVPGNLLGRAGLVRGGTADPIDQSIRMHSGTASRGRMAWLLLTVAALICAISLRPDGVLLWAAIVPGIWWYTRKDAPKAGLRSALLCGLLAVLPLVPWTIRNYHVYHVFQPLAPRSAMDPTETSLAGFDRWTTTWEIDYVSLGEIWWRGDGLTIDIGLLPSRAFDSAQEYRQTAALIAENNDLCTITPELDARFEALAEQRIHRHPLRQYVALPLRAPCRYVAAAAHRIPERRDSPAMVGVAASSRAIAFCRRIRAIERLAADRRVDRICPAQGSVAGDAAGLCCAALRGAFEMPNAEPRYTLEAFPIVIVAAAVAFTKAASQQVSKSASSRWQVSDSASRYRNDSITVRSVRSFRPPEWRTAVTQDQNIESGNVN